MTNTNEMFDRKTIDTRYAIRTRYHGPDTDRKSFLRSGSKISASWDKHRVYVPYSYDENLEQNHARAAQALLDKHFKIDDTQEPKARYVVKLHSGLAFDDDFYWTYDVVV